MTERDLRILKHIGMYRITLRPILARLYFDGNESAMANVLKRLNAPETVKAGRRAEAPSSSGLIKVRGGLPGNISYYQLTRLGARRVGVPEYRAEPFGNQALNLHLALLWFCCAGGSQRFRVSDEDFPSIPPGEYCVTAGERKKLLRVYAPTETAERSSIHRTIAEHAELLLSHPSTAQAVRDRSIGLAILVHSYEQGSELMRAMRSGKGTFGKLLTLMHVVIKPVPSIATLSGMIHELRSTSPD